MSASVKSAHYNQQLFSALLRGSWAESHPGKAPNGTSIGWSELLRKFRKHCLKDDFANVALQTQALSLLLLPTSEPTSSPGALDGDVGDNNIPLHLSSEGILSEEQKQEAKTCMDALQNFTEKSQFKESILLARAHYAYALGNPSECLSILSHIDFDAPPAALSIKTSSLGTSSLGTSADPSLMTIDAALSRTGSVAGSVAGGSRKFEGDSDQETVWKTTELIRGKCQAGMSHESLKDLPSALQAYDSGFALVDSLTATKMRSQNEKAKFEAFVAHREMWRWVERLMRRRAIVASRLMQAKDALSYLRAYRIYSSYWPPNFRPLGRGIMMSLSIHAMCRGPPFPLPVNISVVHYQHNSMSVERSQWYSECRHIAEEYRQVLGASTSFPRAGEHNWPVNDFVDLCVAIWERGGCSESEVNWVIDTMWWATRLTFHSQRIMRHLTRLLLASGNFGEAKRTFKLYVQLVRKARQTGAGDVSLQLKRRPTLLPAEHPDVIAEEEDATDDERGSGEEADSDETFVSTLVFGVRMLCRYGDGEELEEAQRVLAIIQEVVTSTDRSLPSSRGNLCLAKGIVSARQVDFEHEASLRPSHLQKARQHLEEAVQLDPSLPSAFFQLALVQSALRDVDSAVLSARQALELAPKERQAWHLLALLLTAQEDWDNAREVCQLGIDITVEEYSGGGSTNGAALRNDGVLEQDFAITSTSATQSSATKTQATNPALVAGRNRNKLPSPTTLQYPIPIVPFPSKAESFEASIQLWMTQLAIIERLEGAESANERWPEVFAFFSDHSSSGPPGPSQHTSLDLSREVTITQNDNPNVPKIDLVPSSPTLGDGSDETNGTSSRHHKLHKRLLNAPRSLSSHIPKKSLSNPSFLPVGHTLAYHMTAPDLHSPESFQASSIHSRRRSPVGSFFRGQGAEGTVSPPSPFPNASSRRTEQEDRLLSDLWLTSAATFRRMGRIDQAKGAIMEAEILDDSNPNVFVQLGLHHAALGDLERAKESLTKALVIDPDHAGATVHLAQAYIDAFIKGSSSSSSSTDLRTEQAGNLSDSRNGVEMATGMLDSYTRRAVGWDVPEAWYFLAKATGLQGRLEKQVECLTEALRLEEGRCIRSLKVALPRCL